MYVVQYQHGTWDKSDWKFAGLFTDREVAIGWCEARVNGSTWRDSEPGELAGEIMDGLNKLLDAPMRFIVMDVTIDDLVR